MENKSFGNLTKIPVSINGQLINENGDEIKKITQNSVPSIQRSERR
jgi:hypothetical protein